MSDIRLFYVVNSSPNGVESKRLASVARRRGDTGNIHPRSRQTAAAIEKGGAWQSRGLHMEAARRRGVIWFLVDAFICRRRV